MFLIEFKKTKEFSLCQNKFNLRELNPAAGELNSRWGEFSLIWKLIELHTFEIYNVPLEPERAAEAREARRSCEYLKKLPQHLGGGMETLTVEASMVGKYSKDGQMDSVDCFLSAMYSREKSMLQIG